MKIVILLIKCIIFIVLLPLSIPIFILAFLILFAAGGTAMLEPLKFWNWKPY